MFKKFIKILIKAIRHRFSIKNNSTARNSTSKIDSQESEKPDVVATDEKTAGQRADGTAKKHSTTSDESQSQEDTGAKSDSQTDSEAPGEDELDNKATETKSQPDSQTDSVEQGIEKSDDQTSTGQSETETQEVEKQPTDTDKSQSREDTDTESDSQTDSEAPGEDELDNKATETKSQPDSQTDSVTQDKEKADEQTPTGQTETQETEEHATDPDKPQSQEDMGTESNSQTNSAVTHTPTKKDKIGQAGRTKEPWNIGGRRGIPLNVPEGSTNHQAEPNLKPELVCRKNGWQWEIVLVVPEEQPLVEVQQNEGPLSGSNGEYRLNNFSENLTVMYEVSQELVELYNGRSPLIFKLRQKWTGDGRKVRGISHGYFIVFTPIEWTRTGKPPVARETCRDESFSAHYFYSDGNTTVDGFEGHELPSNQEGFSLKGRHIYDDSEKGLLFIGDSPHLEPVESVLWARIGEEGGGDWKGENFKPSEKNVREVLNGRQGWFFVRVFDEDVQLMDSNDFRYSQTLKEIRINDTIYSDEMLLVPSVNGYKETIIQFIDTEGNNIRPEKKECSSHASICNDGAVIVAPHPEGDLTEWKLSSGVDSVDVVITLPRIWWRITKTDGSSDGWCDTPIVMSREEFRENEDAVVQFFLPSSLQKIQVGFGCDLDRSYSTASDDENENKRRIALPIRDFVDYEEMDNPSSKDMYLKIQCNGKVLPIICVPADILPSLIKPLMNEPQVKKPDGGLRRGKGFSYGELRNAHITIDEAKYLGIKMDLRRQTVHQVNIDNLVEAKGEKDAQSE